MNVISSFLNLTFLFYPWDVNRLYIELDVNYQTVINKTQSSVHFSLEFMKFIPEIITAHTVLFYFGVLIILQIFSGLLDEKTKMRPSFGTISTAFPKDVVYAVEPSRPYLIPIPPYLPKEALVTLKEVM